ncbi:MAG TPA: glycosyltransferase family 4 protein [Anaerolineales bacterium]|nr:glycosyltransferase family 4 protein [Anaerolineales bacterium]
MKILTVLTYYRPHTSGLTIYAERLARALVRRGHEVTVLTSRFDRDTPFEEVQDGVRILRAPVLTRLNKGVIMPTIGFLATREVLRHDAILLHLPQFDAAGISLRGRLLKKPTIVAYHSDLLLPPGPINRVVNIVVDVANRLTAVFTHRITAYTDDFAQHSPFLRSYARKCVILTPPVRLDPADPGAVLEFKARHNPLDRRVIGMATRFASEKGVEILLEAFHSILAEYPETKILFAGQHEEVWGEETYIRRLLPEIRRLEAEGRWAFLGVLPLEKMPAFYSNLDVLVVPSLNSTETFGFVQIEAMMFGVPVVASELPGVRVPIRMTGMGEVIPKADPAALAAAVCRVFGDPQSYSGDGPDLRAEFSPDRAAADYERLFTEIAGELES